VKRIKADAERPEDAAAEAAAALRAGGIIIFPAERLYGLGADASRPEAVARVFELKGRDRRTPLPVIVHSVEAADEWVEISPTAQKLISRFWPGPLTLALPVKKELARAVLGGGDHLGIRVPGNKLARRIAAELGGPVTATSANPSGGESTRTAGRAAEGLQGEVDLIIDVGELPGPPGSTVVGIQGKGYEVLREGIISPEEIEAVLK
jgi:L-threonylcarbamoyladenylate synthase